MTYNLNYFIEKLSAIDDDRWTTGTFINNEGQCCAYRHLGERELNPSPTEGDILTKILKSYDIRPWVFTEVNDGTKEYLYLGNTPKERVINFLKQLK